MRPVAAVLLAAALSATAAPSPAAASASTLSAPPAPPASASVAARDGGGLAVTGYALPGLPDRTVAENDGLATLTVVGASLRASGRSVHRVAGSLRVRRSADRHGLRTELLVNNYSNRLGDFDPRAAARLLRSKANVRRAARQLTRLVVSGGWDGVNIDLESLWRADGRGLVRLARELQRRMPAERTVSIDISARGSARAYRRAGYRLQDLGRVVDAVQLMGYDLHGPTWSGPGPVGALEWQRRTVAALLAQVPAAKVDLGVAGYGYTWPSRRTGRTGHTVTVAGARDLVRRDGARPVWDDRAGEWHARLGDGTVLWWSDARSLELRRALAADLGLHGLAIWRIGSADPVR